MDKSLVLQEIQELVDRLYLAGIKVSLARLVVSGTPSFETFDTTMKSPPPSKAALNQEKARNLSDVFGNPDSPYMDRPF